MPAPAVLLLAPHLGHEARRAIHRRLAASGLSSVTESLGSTNGWLAAVAFELDDSHELGALVSHPRVRTVAAFNCRVGQLPTVRGRGLVASYSAGDDRLGDAQRLMDWALGCCLELDLQVYPEVSPSFASDSLGCDGAADHAWRRTTQFIRAALPCG